MNYSLSVWFRFEMAIKHCESRQKMAIQCCKSKGKTIAFVIGTIGATASGAIHPSDLVRKWIANGESSQWPAMINIDKSICQHVSLQTTNK